MKIWVYLIPYITGPVSIIDRFLRMVLTAAK